ncbi:hypothetical protein E2320_003357 [Naja naja]|nr:hypothetical protein E2320_003357 [Naja naja]
MLSQATRVDRVPRQAEGQGRILCPKERSKLGMCEREELNLLSRLASLGILLGGEALTASQGFSPEESVLPVSPLSFEFLLFDSGQEKSSQLPPLIFPSHSFNNHFGGREGSWGEWSCLRSLPTVPTIVAQESAGPSLNSGRSPLPPNLKLETPPLPSSCPGGGGERNTVEKKSGAKRMSWIDAGPFVGRFCSFCLEAGAQCCSLHPFGHIRLWGRKQSGLHWGKCSKRNSPSSPETLLSWLERGWCGVFFSPSKALLFSLPFPLSFSLFRFPPSPCPPSFSPCVSSGFSDGIRHAPPFCALVLPTSHSHTPTWCKQETGFHSTQQASSSILGLHSSFLLHVKGDVYTKREEPSSSRYLGRGACPGDPPVVCFPFSEGEWQQPREMLFSSISFEVCLLLFLPFFLMDVLTLEKKRKEKYLRGAGPSLNPNGKGTWRNMSGVSPPHRCSFRKYSKTPINLEPPMCWSLHPGVFNQPVRWLQVVDVVVHQPVEKLGKAELFHRSPWPTETHAQTRRAHPSTQWTKAYISTATIISHRLIVYPPATTLIFNRLLTVHHLEIEAKTAGDGKESKGVK